MARHPIQPLEEDSRGVLRFKENAIVQHLLKAGPFNLNDLAEMEFSNEDREQFAQLIGYSLSGFGDLPYVSNEVYEAAGLITGASQTEDAVRATLLRDRLATVQDELRAGIAILYGIHPDDLTGGPT